MLGKTHVLIKGNFEVPDIKLSARKIDWPDMK